MLNLFIFELSLKFLHSYGLAFQQLCLIFQFLIQKINFFLLLWELFF